MLRWVIVGLFGAICLSTVNSQQPQIVEDIFPEVKRKGDTGYLNCTVSRQQTNKVVWIQPADGPNDAWISRDTSIIAKNEALNGKHKYEVIRKYRLNEKVTYTLVINNLRVEDSGRYICTIHLVGKYRSEWPVKFGNLTVQVPPTILKPQTLNTVERHQGDSVSLRCNAIGNPTPTITWIRANGKSFPGGSLSHKGHVLNITNIKKDDRGVYRCVAENSVIPPAHHDAKLVVFSKPEVEPVQTSVGQVPNQQLFALLECKIWGMPEPNLRWYKLTKKGLEALLDDEKYFVNQLPSHGVLSSMMLKDTWYLNSLKILNVQENDFGTYYCEARNSLGTSRAEVRLCAPTDVNIVECEGYQTPLSTDSQYMDQNIPVPDKLCTDSGSSTLRYYPQRTDEELRIYCQLNYPTNVSVCVKGVTHCLEISGAQDCETFIDRACQQCVNFDDPNGPAPKYGRMGQELVLTCSGDLAMPASANTFTWYKLTKNSFSEVRIMDNITDNIPDTVPDNSRTVRGSSTLRYYPQPTDEELRIYCDLTVRVTTTRTQRANVFIVCYD